MPTQIPRKTVRKRVPRVHQRTITPPQVHRHCWVSSSRTKIWFHFLWKNVYNLLNRRDSTRRAFTECLAIGHTWIFYIKTLTKEVITKKIIALLWQNIIARIFILDTDVDIEKLDIPVNAVATALKDFFSKRLPPLFDTEMMNELEEIAGSRPLNMNSLSMEEKTDRSCRLIALRGLLNKLPPSNFAVLKYIFQHFVRYVFYGIFFYGRKKISIFFF